jgi:Ca2+-binding RTX toxin-like protein
VGVPAQCVIAAAVAATWCLPSGAMAVEVAIGQPPNAGTIFVTAISGEVNALAITRDASGYTVDENGPATMTPGAGCASGPSPNTATCPAAGISELHITLGDADDGVTVGTATNAVILGGPGNDTIVGGAGADTLDPGSGGDADRDTLTGGEGEDRVSYGLRSEPVVTSKDGLANDGQVGEGDNIAPDVERVTGGLANDTVGGGADADVLDGGPGDDTVDGFAGDDELHGDGGLSAGADNLSGGPGDDHIHGEAGADTLWGGPGADELLGGTERDTVTYRDEPDVTVRLDRGLGSSSEPGDGDRILQVENVDGASQGDTVTGSGEANRLDGQTGEDYVDGGRGVDQLDGGSSADVVVARDRARDEPVSCGPGQDLAIVDERDRVVRRGAGRCEQVDDGRETTPRPGWVYVHPRRCTNADVALGLPAMHRQVPLRYSILLASGLRQRAAPTLDASDCPLRVRATRGQGRIASADVSGAAVTVGQSSGRRVTTTLTVKRPSCAVRGRSPAVVAREPRLRVTTDRRRGRWRVKGKHSIAAARGTDWVTLEGCSRTVTVVRRGRVQVFDRAKRRTVTVRAGQRYVAREGR